MGYEEIGDILNRHNTLTEANNDLMRHSAEVSDVDDNCDDDVDDNCDDVDDDDNCDDDDEHDH